MSDIRFIVIGIVIIFSGFLVVGVFGHNYQVVNIEASEFDKCFEYHVDKEPVEISCSDKIFERTLFFIIVLILIAIGIMFLIKGVRGKWDNDVKPEDMVGPGGSKK